MSRKHWCRRRQQARCLGFKTGKRVATALQDLPGDRWTRTGAVLRDAPEVSDENKRISEEMWKEAEDSLEWRSVCSQVAAFASTSMGRDLCKVGGLPIGRDRGESQKLLDQTMAAVLLPRPLDFSGVDDISRIVTSAVSGKVLSIGELCAVERSLRAARGVYEQMMELSSIDGLSNRYSSLLLLFQNCSFLTDLAYRIEWCVDCNLSVVRDQASEKLQSIRADRRKNIENLEVLLKGISNRIFQGGGIDSPLITRRRSRMCIGIRASHKSLLPDGIILGVSSSGATYFMEPREIVELNNMEVRLSNSEKAEELAILSLLTSDIACFEREIMHLMDTILQVDLASARAAYARWMGSVCPVFCEGNDEVNSNEEPFLVNIEGFCHPLLLEPSAMNSSSPVLSGLPQSPSVIPVDIRVGHTTKVVVISGPNTGGKTATMKSLGLASLMAKAGMFLPAKGTPRLPWFDQVLADIGDHQSLEHNLSTFSGHISRLCKILQIASQKSLVLIDEIGNGTDPSEGVALATSILQHLLSCVSLAVVTTHYADLSLLRTQDIRFENAAMEFCIKTLQPTYRVLWGSIGNSNALSIAKAVGFDPKVLDRAQEWVEKLLPDKQRERQGLLYQSLSKERDLLEAEARKGESVLMEVKKVYHEIHSEAKDLDKREAALKAKESQMALQELKLVRSQVDAILLKFEKQLQDASPDQYNAILRKSEAAIAVIVEAHCSVGDSSEEDATAFSSSYAPIQVGDQVYVKRLGGKVATVVEAPGDDGSVLVQYGKISVRVKRSDLKVARTSEPAVPTPTPRAQQGQRPQRGRPGQEEVKEAAFGAVVQTSRNTALGVLFVVHGVGTGAVKDAALRLLRNHPRVARFEADSPMNDGCTIAYIN
ncbi:unnamed protein product [Spirodela intermedia]|uniref:Smr domain-containing protein n=1 Tax=Spirodela intermedia TaxID=51605 RepID=A0A7I8J8S9_SPIIN|nr:unnamed protein product [Spirodela intermedia]CAA6666597.1 unnamed protein product [Spirodela intermedia]